MKLFWRPEGAQYRQHRSKPGVKNRICQEPRRGSTLKRGRNIRLNEMTRLLSRITGSTSE